MGVRTSPQHRWVLASGNPGKLLEFQGLLDPLGVAIVNQRELGIEDADEPHHTFVENALAKARHASTRSGLAALADDSGICLPALGGAPGVRSARYSDPLPTSTREQVDEANNRKLILQTATLTRPVACFYYCVVVLMRHPEDPRPLIADGTWRGSLAERPRGSNGFGYDPHFFIASLGKCVAELTPAEKNAVSHRGQALRALVEKLK